MYSYEVTEQIRQFHDNSKEPRAACFECNYCSCLACFQTLLQRNFFISISNFVSIIVHHIYFDVYLIKENVKNIRAQFGPKNTVADFSHRCEDLVNDQNNQINIGNITCANNANQVNTTAIREACFGGQEKEQQKASARKENVEIRPISNKKRREKTPKNCHRCVMKKSGAGEDEHLSRDCDAQKVVPTRKISKRPENEFGKALIFILTGFAVSFVPVNIILLINILSPKLTSFCCQTVTHF